MTTLLLTPFLYVFVIFLTKVQGETKYEEIYTAKERQGLNEFYPLAKTLVKKDYEAKDIYLIHWLRAKNLDVKAATEMLKKAMVWRKEKNVDTILTDTDFIATTNKMYPASYGLAVDKVGRPTVQCSFSRWDVRKGYLIGYDFSKFITYNFEKISTLAYASNHSQFMFIIDLNQFNAKQHMCLVCFGFYIEYITQYENYYPNMANKQITINAPRAFEQILTLVKNLMTPLTSQNLKVYGVNKNEWQNELLKFFDASQLSRTFGGTKDRSFFN